VLPRRRRRLLRWVHRCTLLLLQIVASEMMIAMSCDAM
jgi:hypothetical protein